MKAHKLRILVDMDSTIAGFIDELTNRWMMEYPDFPPIPKEQITEFRIDEIYGKLYGEWAQKAIINIYQGPNFFNNLPIFDGAVKALNEMVEEGHDVFFCSTPCTEYVYCVHDKYAWIDKHFGREWVEKVILTRDKTFVSADYIIDDKPEITGVQTPALWKHIYFTQPHNINSEGPRINHWSEWKDVINELEANKIN
jgi:5'-nucleotidase